MIYIRGNPLDFEKWAQDPGMSQWGYAHCSPYFSRAETRLAGADAFHGYTGPLKLERGPCTNPLFQAFFAATEEAGYPRTEDVNGFQQEGFGHLITTSTEGDACLRPVRTSIPYDGNVPTWKYAVER
jgi:choline dehydrogenase